MRVVVVLFAAVALGAMLEAAAQSPPPNAGRAAAPRPETAREAPLSQEQLKAAIDRLGTVDYAVRTSAARALRRAPIATVAPALVDAVSRHADGYVRFRALVLLSGMNEPRTHDVMVQALSSPNDRLRTAAYAYFEHNPDTQLVPRMLDA